MSNSDLEMKASWNLRAQKNALFYIETNGNQDQKAFFALGEERARLLIDPVLKSFQIEGVGNTAIDVGCGVGRFTQALGRRFGRVIGIDVSDVMVAQAKEAAHGLSNLEFIAGDGVCLPQPGNSADFVWSYEVIQHMPSHEIIQSTLREVARVLRPSGYGLLHFRSAHEYPTLLWHIARFLPTSLIRLAKRMLGKDPLTADQSWRGAKPVTRANIQEVCENASLEIVEFRDDPTHKPGTRTFAVVRSRAH